MAPNSMLEGIPDENLAGILHDRWRVEAGERALSARIRAGTLSTPVGVALLDLDGSAPIRLRGVAAKLRLVDGVRELVNQLAPLDALVTDSGERDEIYIVLPGWHADDVLTFAEELRAAIAGRTFEIFGPDDTVRVTASIGCAVLPDPASGAEVFERARDGLVAAKRVRDCVRLAEPGARRTGLVAVPPGLGASGLLADVFRTGMWMLAEKHGPIWYWVNERGGATALAGDAVPDPAFTTAEVDTPPAALSYFTLLVQSTALEAGLMAWVERGWGAELSVQHSASPPRGYPLVAQYQPGEWVAARRGDGQPYERSEVFACIQRARIRGFPDPADRVPVGLGPYADSVLASLARPNSRSPEQLLCEALWLGIDHLAAHGGWR